SCGFAERQKFFFQAEDGIRDGHVTGVQTCALPICSFPKPVPGKSWWPARCTTWDRDANAALSPSIVPRLSKPCSNQSCSDTSGEIGRASCRERVESWAVEA